MLQLPLYIPLVFVLTVLVTFVFLMLAIRQSAVLTGAIPFISVALVAWLLIQRYLAVTGFYYTDTTTIPPRFILLPLPPVVFIIVIFATGWGRRCIDSLPLTTITYLSIVRIPVELCLYWLCLYKYVPALMTFAGRNFDIISGITAPLIAYSWQKGMLRKNMFLLWHIAALLSLINIVGNAVLSAPFFLQRFAFDQPNVAVLYFPFVWLPCFIVPVVLFSHLVSIRRLTSS